MMTGAILAETPNVEYGQLGPEVHDTVERILDQRNDGSFRVDNITAHTVDTIRDVLGRSIGERLPDYRYDEDGSYIQMGRTPIVEERHSRVMVLDRREAHDKSLWLRVPRYSDSTADAEQSSDKPEITKPDLPEFTKKDMVIFGVGGVAVNFLIAKGLMSPPAEHEQYLAEAGAILDLSLMSYFFYRLTRGLVSQMRSR